MNFIPEPGLIYDTISYTVIYFNKSAYAKNQRPYNDRNTDPFEYYDNFRSGKRKLDPPDSLFPFFYYNNKKGAFSNFSLMLSYFWNHYDFITLDTEAFFASLSSESFRGFCYHYYFDSLGDSVDIDGLVRGGTSDCMRAFASFSHLGDRMASFLDFILNFDALIPELTAYLEDCRKRMLSYHGQQSPGWVESIYETYASNEALIKASLKSSSASPADAQPFTVHLMDHLVIFNKYVSGMDTELYFIGVSGIKNILSWTDYSHITIQSLGLAFGNDVKRDIIFQLKDGEKTVSQLSKLLYTSRSTIDRCVSSLYDSLVIRIVKKIGTENYYALNPRYFLVAKAEVNRVIDQIIKQTSEN